MSKEDLMLLLKFLSTLFIPMLAYHKYLMVQIDKKMDKDLCNAQQKIILEKRAGLEQLVEERTRTIFKQQKEMKEDLAIIKEYLLKR